MKKIYNGYFSVYDEIDPDDLVYNLKVENNKITGATFSGDRDIRPKEIETLLSEIIGEDFKDFTIEKMLDKQDGANWKVNDEHSDIDLYDRYRIEEMRHANDLGLSVSGYQKKVASILEAKERKSILGKTDVLDKISQIKNNRSPK